MPRRSFRCGAGDRVALGGDGQVTLGTTVMKADAVKVRKLLDGQVLVGFAGSAADGFALLERFEAKLKDYPNNVPRAATELAKLWRTDRMLRRLEAVLVVVDARHSLLVSGSGDVIQPSDGILATGSGRRLRPGRRAGPGGAHRPPGRRDRPPVADDRRRDRHLHQQPSDGGGTPVPDLTPRADRRRARPRHRRPGRGQARRGDRPAEPLAAPAARRTSSAARSLPKNIMLIGPTGVGKTEIARRLAKLVGAPFVKVEATKYTEVGYYGRDVESLVRDLVEAAHRPGQDPGARAGGRAGRRRGPSSGCSTCSCPRRRARGSTPSRSEADEAAERRQRSREKMKARLEAGELEDREVEVTLPGRAVAPVSILGAGNLEQMEMDLQGMFEKILPKPSQTRTMTVAEARPHPGRAGDRGPDRPREGPAGRRARWPRSRASSSSTRSTRSPATRGAAAGGRTSRARASSATCCRSSRGRPSPPSTGRSRPTTSCSSPPAPSTAASRPT